MRIFLADISHDTVGLATEVFPLNIGFMAAYTKKVFDGDVDISLFKYASDLEAAIECDPPDILALSNYPWCHNIGLAFFRQLEKRRPDALRIMGGPNFPHQPEEQAVFLRKRPLLDAYVYLDGEKGFSNLLRLAFETGSVGNVRAALTETSVEGCVQLDCEGNLLAKAIPLRTQELDEIPSPYLTGVLDQFFDGRLSPMIQTHRGCPFRCTYCADGSDLVNRVNQFSTERVCAEIRYIADRVPKKVNTLHIADLNFGMYKRDAEICETIAEVMRSHNYPLNVETATGKNSKQRIIGALEKLQGTLNLAMSVQSLTPGVLKNIKRDNIRLNDFLELRPYIKKANLPTSSEIILALPGETLESHLDSLNSLMVAGVDRITPYTLMMLNGSEMATAEQRCLWGIKTKYRVLPRDFTRLKISACNVVEIEEVVIETNSLSFDNYLKCRKTAFLISMLYTQGFKPVIKLLVQSGVRPIEVFLALLDHLDSMAFLGENGNAVDMLRDFHRDTIEELWDSEEQILSFFEDEKHFHGLIDGRYGTNLIHTYRARAYVKCIEEFAERFFMAANAILKKQSNSGSVLAVMAQAQAYSLGIIHNLLGENRLSTVPEVVLGYDFKGWIDDQDDKSVFEFAWPTNRKVRFVLTDDQFQLLEDALDRCGRHDVGLGKAMVRMNPSRLWRHALAEF